MKSLHKTSCVLDCFTSQTPRLTLSDVAATTGFPPSTVHRLLRGLKDIGLVVQDGNRDSYRLGLRLLSLGGVVLSDLDVPKHARQPASELMTESGETVHVCVFDGRNVVSVDRHEMAAGQNEIIRLEREPPYCTGTGKAVLAALPEHQADALLPEFLAPFTPHTFTDKPALKRELAEIRGRGYSIDNEERQLGVRCVGAVLRHHKKVVGAISVTGPRSRFPRARIPVLAERVMATAARISLSIETG